MFNRPDSFASLDVSYSVIHLSDMMFIHIGSVIILTKLDVEVNIPYRIFIALHLFAMMFVDIDSFIQRVVQFIWFIYFYWCSFVLIHSIHLMLTNYDSFADHDVFEIIDSFIFIWCFYPLIHSLEVMFSYFDSLHDSDVHLLWFIHFNWCSFRHDSFFLLDVPMR